ncbi:hypothetical protein JTE90_016048 [Oedothorax gibbosus]|uniref:Uncharacterized protein n=1 Tax=Oedothorax gibbosus TaxID=931172 RepID=A0AAV6U4K6_9ARAC|nr:hypothetical protein JTE90_016048 [Oedothorax gibbosus]
MAAAVDSEEECLLKYASQSPGWCPAAWDSLVCWPPAPSGDTLAYPCATLFPHLANDTVSVAFRTCSEDGQWSQNGWTNYSQCMQLDLQLQEEATPFVSPFSVSVVILVGSLISLVCLGAAVIIFTAFRSLYCCRIRVHRCLVLSLALHALFMVVVACAGLSPTLLSILDTTAWLCRGLVCIKCYASLSSVLWMFVEGLLLHASVASSVFEPQPYSFTLMHAIGWGIPGVCVVVWACLMWAYFESTSCWRGYGRSPLVWIVTGPMMAALTVNAVFLVNIIRILVTKMRSNVAIETKQIIKAARATALLFPLLGITHLLFCVNPGGDFEPLYMLTNAILQSSQGLFVAVLYCFLNSEVQSAVSAAYSRRRSSAWSVVRSGRSFRTYANSVTSGRHEEIALRDPS